MWVPQSSLQPLAQRHPPSNLDKSFYVFNTLLQAKVPPTLPTLRALLSACIKVEQPQRGLSLATHLDEHGLIPDAVCFGLLVTVCGKARDLSLARQLVSKWQKGQGPRTKTEKEIRAPINGQILLQLLAQNRDLEAAFRVFDLVCKDTSHKPSLHLIGTLISGCIQSGQPKLAFAVADYIENHGIALNPVIYSLLASACFEAGGSEASGLGLRLLRLWEEGKKPR